MRPGTVVVLIAAATFALAVAKARGTQAYQHIANGGFEDGLSGWSVAPGVSIDVSHDAPAEGLASAHFTVGGYPARMEYALPGALGAGTYVASLKIRGDSSASITLSIAPGSQPRFEVASTGVPTTWQAVSGSFTLGAPTVTTLAISVDAVPGAEVFVDDVQLDGASPITLTPTPTRTLTPAAGSATSVIAVATEPTTGPATPTPTVTTSADVIGPALRNAGFEEVASDDVPLAWEKYGGRLSSDDRARGGARAGRLESQTTSTKWLHQAVVVDGGGWYAFDAWVLHSDPGVRSAFLRVSWYMSADGSGTAIHTVDSTAALDEPATGYRWLTTGAVQAPVDASSARARVMLAPVSEGYASILVDDAWFGPASPPPPAPAPAQTRAATEDRSGSGPRLAGAARSDASDARTSARATLRPSSASADVVINEVLYDADSDAPDAAAEWVELYNSGNTPIDLSGWALADASSADTLPPVVLPSHAFAIVAASSEFRDAFPDVAAPVIEIGGRIGNGLGNDGDSLRLVDSTGAVVDAISWGDDVSAFDPAVADVPAGHSIEREFAGADSNTARDFVDNERPSPGFEYSGSTKPKQLDAGRDVRIIEAGDAGAFGWLPWAVAAAAAGVCAGTIGWRAFEGIRRARHS